MSRRRLITAIEIDGAGGHPAAWRGPEVDPAAILTGELALRAVQRAEAAGVDIATFADALEAPADIADRVSVRLDALGLAARIAPATERIGLLPTITVTHTEPFHVQASVATLDYISSGRGGWVADVSSSEEAAAVIGRREPAPAADTWREARYVVDVSRHLWDSWEDDAIIRDASTGRFIDRDRIHYVDYSSPTFNIKGPSIVPRPPQGHPITAIRVNTPEALETAAEAELVLLPGVGELEERLAAIRVGAGSPRVLVSVGVLLDEDPAAAALRADGASHLDHIGGVERLADLIGEWAAAGVDGVQLRPASLEVDVPVIAERLIPLLRARKLIGPVGRAATLRSRLGLARPGSRYVGSER
ncbi:alkanesulfonate monooxygenase SsuD/methylene tetrahydromethanopterin reductase-like flavin-dependent oxidoreductase (luciferase family) [Kribbella steppae]|uniref:Alkanesulfonate monooxygenase SsuD/methylene tetrahydromethanopterin reductase-like flavin-dependent oxidoreductase (Luciferase family) n=1 Tax=Kribbella steppae TaxID=2512223 RepID=A0A4R2HN63_9ACTN|nr:LLM class flavin-dependent oxidoreductase [Kribbella steppae]TCO30041.1 alkanesulfonate monooxygenase SsuD/methylene tetrahydromethanopterin reductase-like flavin-dependent oxidoreductase (luciferase family) [Kribbella steppae]